MKRTALVGRVRELGVLTEGLEGAMAGSPQVIVCEGEPGIGKTRLARELASCAAGTNALTAWGAAEEFEGVPPFWPWWQVLRTLAERADLVGRAEARGIDGDLAGVAPDLFTSRHGARQANPDRFRQFDAVGQVLCDLSNEKPLVVVLDDLHWADPPTLLLLHHVARTAREARLLIVATTRLAEQRHGELLGRTLREPVTTTLRLGGLDRSAVRAQLEQIVERAVDDAAVARVEAATGGNPFFVTEVARSWATRAADDDVVVTPTLHHAIADRVRRLSREAASFVRAAAVAGESFSLRVVATASASAAPAAGLVDEAARASLIERVAAPDSHRFVHALVREAVLASLDTVDRVDLHRRMAVALEQHHGAEPGPHLFEIARHWLEVSAYGDASVAVRWARRAGDEAMRQLAYEEGARWYTHAYELDLPTEDADRVGMLIALGHARLMAGDLSGHMAACEQAAAVAARIGRADLLADAALVMDVIGAPGFDIATRRACESALDALPVDDAVRRARVTARYLETFQFRQELVDLGELSDQAVTLARSSGDPVALADALRAARVVHAGPDGLDHRHSLAMEMLGLGRSQRRADMVLSAQLWLIDVLFERGDLVGVGHAIEALTRAAAEVRGPLATFEVKRCHAVLAQAQGRFSDARVLEEDAHTVLAPTGHQFGFVLRTGLLSIIAHHTGYDAKVAAANEPFLAQPGLLQSVGLVAQVALALALIDAGEVDTARSIFHATGPVAQWRPPPHVVLVCHAYAVAVAVALGRAEDVAAARRALDPHRGHHVVSGTGQVAYSGPVELWLGRAARHLGDLDAAVDELDAARVICQQRGASGFEVESTVELAAALIDRGAVGDAKRAQALLVAARGGATALGMQPFSASIDGLAARLAASRSDPLSRREREVAVLVADGLTNKQIAARLFLSERTAENHVQHILTKLGLANRAQIAVWSATNEGGF